MQVVYTDGGILSCHKIEFYQDEIVADEYRIIPIFEVARIVEDAEEQEDEV